MVLSEKGADIQAKGRWGRTALWRSSLRLHIDTVGTPLEKRAYPAMADENEYALYENDRLAPRGKGGAGASGRGAGERGELAKP